MSAPESSSGEWTVHASRAALRTTNPIRALVDSLRIAPNPAKTVLKLSLGDPTVYGNLPPPAALRAAVHAALDQPDAAAGYQAAHGVEVARAAVAARWANAGVPPARHVDADAVCIASGCSHALQIALAALVDPGCNVLLPRPGFAVYQTICEFGGAACKFYDLDPARHWEVDLASLEAAIDTDTRAILINNPSNPCGSVYSAAHLRDLLAVAEKHRLPIIADEVYAHMAFGEHRFTSLAALSERVPVLACGGLAKQYLVPGWRIGWLVLHDRDGVLARGRVLDGVRRISQVLIGANTLVQAAIPAVLSETPEAFYKSTLAKLEANAKIAFDALSAIPALKPIAPQGAMYMMVGIDIDALDVDDDLKFCEQLFSEESVFVLPGQCFKMKNFFRVVLCPPEKDMAEAIARMSEFCQRHAK